VTRDRTEVSVTDTRLGIPADEVPLTGDFVRGLNRNSPVFSGTQNRSSSDCGFLSLGTAAGRSREEQPPPGGV
jgi:hypothetical protein